MRSFDSANLDDLDRLFDSEAGKGKDRRPVRERRHRQARSAGQITEQHFDNTFDLNVRGTLITVQKALPLFNDGGSIFMTRSNAAAKVSPVSASTRRASWRYAPLHALGSTS